MINAIIWKIITRVKFIIPFILKHKKIIFYILIALSILIFSIRLYRINKAKDELITKQQESIQANEKEITNLNTALDGKNETIASLKDQMEIISEAIQNVAVIEKHYQTTINNNKETVKEIKEEKDMTKKNIKINRLLNERFKHLK